MTYHDVEKNHGVEHICDIPNFKPIKPYIHVSIIKDLNGDSKIKSLIYPPTKKDPEGKEDKIKSQL